MEDCKNEVSEITEIISILYDKRIIQQFEESVDESIDNCEDFLIDGNTIKVTIKHMSEIKVKSYPSVSSKTIFKFMDMIEM